MSTKNKRTKNSHQPTNTFGALLLAARKAAKLNQQVAATRAGVAVRTWSRWEKGETEPTLRDIAKAAAALGVGLIDLIPEAE